MRRFSHLCVPASLVALLLAGCGGGAASGGADPASIMPATADVYVEGVVRPEGDQREDVLDAAGKLLRTSDPEKRMRELFDQALAKSDAKGTTYEKDFKPWLGNRVGVYATNFQKEDADVLIAVATTDSDKARKSVVETFGDKGEKLRDGSYKGVDYKIDSKGMAAGIVDDFLAIGDEAQFKRGVDASKGKSLADQKRYKDAIGRLDGDRIGTAFVDVKSLFDAAAKADPSSAGDLEQARRLFGFDKLQPVSAALLADGDRIAVDSAMTVSGGSDLLARLSLLQGEGPGKLLGDLPGDAWLAYGVPKLGEGLKTVYGQFAGALGGAALSGQIKQQTGLDLEQDVFSWIGDTGLFVRGTSTSALEGALVIEATDPAKAKTAVTKLVGAAAKQSPVFGPEPLKLPGADVAFQISGAGTPQPVIVAVGKGRTVVAVGEKAARDGLAAGAKLADAAAFKSAVDTLGDNGSPSLYLSMPEVLKLADASSGSEPGYQKAKPYLEAISALISGGKKDGDQVTSRFAIGLK